MARPGASLTDFERWIGLLGDAVDQLESEQAIGPSPALEAIADTVRFVRDAMARNRPAELDELDARMRPAEVPEEESVE